MMITALMWGCFLLITALALGCALAVFLLSFGIFQTTDKDPEMCILCAIFVVLLVAMGIGFTFAAIAIGRNLL